MTKNTRLKYCLAAVACMLFTIATKAQMVNCNGFLKGNYIEAGVNWNGCFGSSTRPPAGLGYHIERQSSLYNASACGGTNTTDSAIGFVADPAKDGWDAGSPARFGDYILPGTPQEGWSYMADGLQIDAWNAYAASSDSLGNGMVSSIVAYTDTLGVKMVKTQAIKDGIYITQFYSLDAGASFINVQVLIENTSLATVGNVAYMRTINPHNDQSLSSVAATKNKIDYALPDTLSRSVVSTRGTVYGDAYLALATQDPRAKGFIYKNTGLPTSTTIDNIYSGDANYFYNQNDSNVSNTSIGLIFDLGNLNSGGAVHFNFIYAFNSSVIDSTLNTVDTHLAVRNVAPANFKAYPNPVANTFNVTNLQPGDALEVYDMMGRKAVAFEYNNTSTYNMEGLQSGYYLLAVKDKQGIVKARLPLQKE
jgi:hypothetical protein